MNEFGFNVCDQECPFLNHENPNSPTCSEINNTGDKIRIPLRLCDYDGNAIMPENKPCIYSMAINS